MSFSIFNDKAEQAHSASATDEDSVESIELSDLRESVLAKDILTVALGEVAIKQDCGEEIVRGKTFSVQITEEIADPGEVTDLGECALRTAMAMHRDSHHPFLVSVTNDTSGGESAEFIEFMFI